MPEDQIEHYLHELHRVVSPTGRIIASVPFPENSPPHHGNFEYPRDEFEALFARCDFDAELLSVNVQSWYRLLPRATNLAGRS